MFSELIKFKDLDGKDVEEKFDFNLNSAEMAEMEVEVKDGMKEYFEKIIRDDNRGEIVKAFKKILLASVGRRSEDNRRFMKTQQISDDFQFSGAYEVMFFKLLGDAEYASKFVENVFPRDLVEKIKAGKPVTVDLPASPVSLTPNLNTATPNFAAMTDADFAAWRLRQSSPLGI